MFANLRVETLGHRLMWSANNEASKSSVPVTNVLGCVTRKGTTLGQQRLKLPVVTVVSVPADRACIIQHLEARGAYKAVDCFGQRRVLASFLAAV
jgi:hypothetical protein